ncbi:MAG TPA: FtsQ-type POTRA domain-containing protein [Clostridiales bacterium]|nr:FtsQ-type POTRA domain-containing protein [Clostridiales bacterium]
MGNDTNSGNDNRDNGNKPVNRQPRGSGNKGNRNNNRQGANGQNKNSQNYNKNKQPKNYSGSSAGKNNSSNNQSGSTKNSNRNNKDSADYKNRDNNGYQKPKIQNRGYNNAKASKFTNGDFEQWQVTDDSSKYKPAQKEQMKNNTDSRRSVKKENNNKSTRSSRNRKSSFINKEEISEKGKEVTETLKHGVSKVFVNTSPEDEVYINEEALQRQYNDGFYTDEVAMKHKRKNIIKSQGNKKPVKIKAPMSRRQRKIRNITLSAITLAVVLLIGVVLSLTVLFNCEAIEVDGVTLYSEQQVIDISGLHTGENLFLSQKKNAENMIIACFPYIDEVKVSIRIPNTTIITVKEATPSYYIKEGSQYLIISGKGRILDVTDENTMDIPVITGCKLTDTAVGAFVDIENENVMPVLNEINQSINKNNVAGVKEIDIDDMARIKLNYEDRITIVIGVPEDIDYKIRVAMEIINNHLAVTDKGELDVSNSNGEKKESPFRPDLSVEEATQISTQNSTEQYTQSPTDGNNSVISPDNDPPQDDVYSDDVLDSENTDIG